MWYTVSTFFRVLHFCYLHATLLYLPTISVRMSLFWGYSRLRIMWLSRDKMVFLAENTMSIHTISFQDFHGTLHGEYLWEILYPAGSTTPKHHVIITYQILTSPKKHSIHVPLKILIRRAGNFADQMFAHCWTRMNGVGWYCKEGQYS